MFKQSYTFKEIGLVPNELSTINSRNDVQTESRFLGFDLSLPILVSPMEKVVGHTLSNAVTRLGGLAVLPRTNSIEYDLGLYAKNPNSIPSIPCKNFEDRVEALSVFDCRVVCIDVANGFHSLIEKAVKALPSKMKVITGNVASLDGYKYLEDIGVHAVRVGVGNGANCSTSIATGVGVGQASLIREIANYRRFSCGPLIIADGGIKAPGEMCKAVALGADVVMSGRLFAGLEECPGPVVMHNGQKLKSYAGQASRAIKGENEYVEGADLLVPYKGRIDKLWKSLDQGLRSAMSYMNCRNIEELKCLPDECFTILSNSSITERNVHALL